MTMLKQLYHVVTVCKGEISATMIEAKHLGGVEDYAAIYLKEARYEDPEAFQLIFTTGLSAMVQFQKLVTKDYTKRIEELTP